MKYKTVDQLHANEVLDRMEHSGVAVSIPPAAELKAGSGELIEDSVFKALSRELSLLTQQLPDTQTFDAQACVLLHQSVPDEPEMLRSDGFWRWLAVGPLQQVITWRFPAGRGRSDEDAPTARINRVNFGIGASARQRSECYPYKLWLRAELGFTQDGGDPYRFAERGDVDFWTSHIHRQTYTTNRRLCRALVRFQLPDDRQGRPLLLPGAENPAAGRLGIRTLAKRIRRLQASCELSVLEEHELEELLSELAKDLKLAR